MSRSLGRRRSGVVALTCAGLTLGAGALGALGGPATSAVPISAAVADCAEPFPVAEVAKGDLVDGLTVVSGTTPEPFTGEVLGVLRDGVSPGIDMIMIDLDMPAFDETDGVWQGMSGSPVYGEDGRLLGAVAYGLSYGASTIAGITPFELMDDYLATEAPAASARLSGAQARLVAERAGLTRSQAAQGFRELPIPFGVAGVSARRLQQAQERGPSYLQKDTYVLGRAGADAPGPETIVAGGNLAASASYGDITFAGVGTATSVCNGDVVGFGHPLYQLGETQEGLHPADALYVQPDSLGAPFKVANISPIAGTITQDRLTGLTGTFGDGPEATTITSTVTYGESSRTGTTDVSVADALAEAAFYQLLTNNDRVLGGNVDGTAVQGWSITGDDDGEAFELSFTDRYTGGDLIFDPIYQLSDLMYALTSIDGVTVDAVTADNTVTDDTSTHSFGFVEQKRGGSWVRVSPDAPAKVKAGGTLRLRLFLTGSAGKQTLRIPDFTVPRKAAGRAKLTLRGGNSSYSYFYGRSIKGLQKKIDAATRHDEVEVTFGTRGGGRSGGSSEGGSRGPGSPAGSGDDPTFFLRTATLGPVDHVVGGNRTIPVRITT